MSKNEPTLLGTIVRPVGNLIATVIAAGVLLACVIVAFVHPEWHRLLISIVTILLIGWSALMAWRLERERKASSDAS